MTEPEVETPAKAELLAVVRHLAHELRQPLSGMESITFYLEMALPEMEPEVREQFERMRNMLLTANWILEDTVHAVRMMPAAPEAVLLNEVIGRVTSERMLHDEPNVQLHLDETLAPVWMDAKHADTLVATLLDFFRHFAQNSEPLLVSTKAEEGMARMGFRTAEPRISGYSLRRLLDPHAAATHEDDAVAVGSIRRLVAANGGKLDINLRDDGDLDVQVRLPLA